jgi:hypothetical protein
MSEKEFTGDIENVKVHELSDEEIIEETLKHEEVPVVKTETASSQMKNKLSYASGHCTKCGRYTAVPIIGGAPQCKCYTN